MASWKLPVFSALIYCLVVTAAGQPSCVNVPDFGRCSGQTSYFCPEGIECSCKDGQAFCSCPYYKGPNTDYWYMGSKCDFLWSTWDLIIIVVCPAVALAFVVAVMAQLIHFCKTKSHSKSEKEPKKKSERQTTNTHHNEAFVPDAHNISSYQDNPQIPRAMPMNPSRSSYFADVPQADYDFHDQRGPQQFPRVSMPTYPQDDYSQGFANPRAGWANRSMRPQFPAYN
ncbi:uncharacterized protein LOC142101394 [Mixophyes fleayi]|uniref:uncharacterized protein LOC142101394 n=1 Tax=Mixophyes fleayi TaxID=3061075 RepID=UPI003F4DED51